MLVQDGFVSNKIKTREFKVSNFFQPGIDRFVTGSLILFISVIDVTEFNVLFIRRLHSWSYSYIPKVYDHDDFSANETS
jgi:hypothetical protein